MNEQNPFNFKALLEPLKKPDVSLDVFKQAQFALLDAQEHFRDLLSVAAERNKGSKDYEAFYGRVIGKNAAQLIESLRGVGYRCRSDKTLRDAFERQGYRLLEQTRAGKRDDVYYGILRVFVSAKKEFPLSLVEAFKPIYSNEMFKVFLFSFLSGVLGKEE